LREIEDWERKSKLGEKEKSLRQREGQKARREKRKLGEEENSLRQREG
jgi:hypothetical protein